MLEEDIVAWVSQRPAWQKDVVRRICRGEALTSEEVAALVDQLLTGTHPGSDDVSVDEIPGAPVVGEPVRLDSISGVRGVNALLPDQELVFAPSGLTIVYGDNGSGKSGYARLVREAVTARVKRDLLGNVYKPDRSSQAATFAFSQSGQTRMWSLGSQPHHSLSSVRFYDEECGDAYVTRAAEVSYRPSALTILDGLSATCVAVQKEVDRRLLDNKSTRQALPTLADGTRAATFIAELSAVTTAVQIDDATKLEPGHSEELAKKLAEQLRLSNSDPRKEKVRLNSLVTDYTEVLAQVRKLVSATEPPAVEDLSSARTKALEQRAAAVVASATTFEAEPVPGVGSGTWRALWEAARTFAVHDGHQRDFPPTEAGDRCVLCHQVLDEAAASRFERFHLFMTNTTERDAKVAERVVADQRKVLDRLAVQPHEVTAALGRLVAAGESLEKVESTLSSLAAYAAALSDWLGTEGQERPAAVPAALSDESSRRLDELKGQAEALTVASYEEAVVQLRGEIQELEASGTLAGVKDAVVREVERLAERASLTEVRRLADTTGITRKTTELTTTHVTAIVRDYFTRETERLQLGGVTLNPAGGRRDTTLQHQPALLGVSEPVQIEQVLSEGEQTALGLAGFLTEVHFDSAKSAIVLDDPVSSLDSKRRSRVAQRVVELAKDRQVIVFSHDAPFINALNREAEDQAVAVARRTVARRADQPGHVTDKHPWAVKDVPERINQLEADLARIKKDRSTTSAEDYADRVQLWAGRLSQAWERAVNVGVVSRVVDPSTNEVKIRMFKLLVPISEDNERDLQSGYGRTSEWAARHDQALEVNFTPPEPDELDQELQRFRTWFKQVSKYGT